MKTVQSRKWSLVTYLPENDALRVIAAKELQVRTFALATHDKDTKEDGSAKEKHTHIVLWLQSPISAQTVKNWFRGCDEKGELANTLAEPCKDICAMFRYLTHKDNPDKYQYDDSIVVCSDIRDFEEESTSQDDTFAALMDVVNGVPLSEVARRYGRDFIYHYSHIKALATDILTQECGRENNG